MQLYQFRFDNLTMYDERASALFDESGDHKAIAKKDMLFFDQKGGSLRVNEAETLNAAYILVEDWIPLKNTGISFHLEIEKLGELDLLTLKHGGYVRLTQEKLLMHLVTEGGEFDIDMSITPPLGQLTSFDMYWHDGRVGVRYGTNKAEFELPNGCQDQLEASGFFGYISNTTASIHAISVEPWFQSEATQKKLENMMVEELTKSVNKEMMDTLMGCFTGTTQYHQPDKRMPHITPLPPLTPLQALPTAADHLSRLTGIPADQLKQTDRKDLIRLAYNGIAEDGMFYGHIAILKEAHYAVARFLDGDQSMTTPDISIGDKTYNTFEFGEVSSANCTPQKLLYLVKTYPEVWLKRLV